MEKKPILLNRKKSSGIESRANPQPSSSQLFAAEGYRKPARKTAGKVFLKTPSREM